MDQQIFHEVFVMINQFLEFVGPIVAFGAGVGMVFTFTSWVGHTVIRAFAEVDTDMEITPVDQRKKKRDEYDAYYDERLADLADDQSSPTSDEVAYYEDTHSGNVVSG